MPVPVLVVHGVANRVRADFETTVANLGQALGKPWDLIPVFWGDLGPVVEHITDTLPVLEEMQVRSLAESASPALVTEVLENAFGRPVVRSTDDRQEIVIAAATEGKKTAASEVVRGDDGTKAIRQAIQEEWSQTRYLQKVQDPAVLAAAGQLLAAAAREAPPHAPQGEFATRGPYDTGAGPYETRVFGGNVLKHLTKVLVNEVDNLLGAAVGAALGGVNQRLRQTLGPRLGEFFGDAFVYQRNRAKIQQRLWDGIAARAPGYGTQEKPINAIAHSFGGVVTFDSAVAAQPPLWIKALVTFGSQSALFHVLDQREQLTRYERGNPVVLPPTIGRWTNLWEPMDCLAYGAARVFRLHNGDEPREMLVSSPASALADNWLWTHGVYWKTDELLRAMRETLIP